MACCPPVTASCDLSCYASTTSGLSIPKNVNVSSKKNNNNNNAAVGRRAFVEGGIASGNVDITESVNGATNTLSSSWSGVIAGGTASANIVASNVVGTAGTYNLTGSFTASKQ